MGAGLDMMTRSYPLETMHVTLLENGVFADVIKVRIMGEIMVDQGGPKSYQRVLLRDEKGGPRDTEEGHVKQRQRWSDVATSQGLPGCGLHKKLEEAGRQGTLILGDFRFQNRKRINVCCLKPSSL